MTILEEAPAWARGLDMAFLQEAAALYRGEFKIHTHGAFGVPKERDVADARCLAQLMWTRSAPSGPMAAVAMFRQASVGSTHQDFAGRQAKISPGDLFIRSIAGAREGKSKIIGELAGRARARAVWIEGHIENRELVEQLAGWGFQHVMTKISASSDLKALWLCAAPNELPQRIPSALNPADKPGIKVINLIALAPADEIAIGQELANLAAGDWAQHYSSYNKRSSWTSFALAGYDPADPSFIIKPAEMSKDWKAKNPERLTAPCGPTIMAQAFPAAMRVVDRIPGRKQRVRFMRLGANGGELTRHADITDPEAGTKDEAIARLHIPIVTDPRCLFRSWRLDGLEERLHFPKGTLCYIDTRKPHAVINPSDVERIHLVIDVHSGPELRKMIGG